MKEEMLFFIANPQNSTNLERRNPSLKDERKKKEKRRKKTS